MPDYILINANDAATTSVNAGGKLVPKRGIGGAVSLTDIELAAYLLRPGVAVVPAATNRKQMRAVAKALQYRKVTTL